MTEQFSSMQQLDIERVCVTTHHKCRLEDQPRALRASLAIARAAPGSPAEIDVSGFTPTAEVCCWQMCCHVSLRSI